MMSIFQEFIGTLIKDHLKAKYFSAGCCLWKVLLSQWSAFADVLIIYQANKNMPSYRKKHQVVVGIIRQELKKQNTVTN